MTVLTMKGEPMPIKEDSVEDIAARIAEDIMLLKHVALQDIKRVRNLRFDNNGTYGWSRWYSLCKRNLESMDSIISQRR